MVRIKKTIGVEENITVAAKSPSRYKNISWTRMSLLLLAIVLILWSIFSFFVRMNSWKAVFLDNNQVFFGKFITIPFSSDITLHKAYYIRSSLGTASSTVSGADVVSIKDNLHSPRDFLVISRAHILFSEELNNDGILAKSLSKEETKGK